MIWKQLNYRIIIPVFLLSIISIVSVYSALTYTSSSLGNLAVKQGIWYIVGWILVIFLMKYKNEYLDAPKDKKSGTFYGSFIDGAIAHKGLVCDRIYQSGNKLVGFVREIRND